MAIRAHRGHHILLLTFAATLFFGSMLLFLIQPMAARLVLPLLGGTPAVWNTCMVFFQAGLLAGYAYAQAAPARLGLRRHALLHLLVLLVPLIVLPVAVQPWSEPDDRAPVLWLLGLLLVSVGLPFFVLSTTAPLLQQWFAATAHPAADDPYFLYAASNLGSMCALLGYPFLVEPALALAQQRLLWSGGYLLYVGLTALCAILLYQQPARPAAGASTAPPELSRAPGRAGLALPSPMLRLRWLLLAFVPSSLMLSATTTLTTDLAPIPLLWVLPLTLYLLSFILVFSRRQALPHAVMVRWMPLVVLVLVLVLLSEATEPAALLVPVHLLGLFWISMVCHGELARTRPATRFLGEFYLWMSAGGVLGGMCNALIAPLLFPALVEYPLVLVLACLLRPAPHSAPGRGAGEEGSALARVGKYLDFVLPALLGGWTFAVILGMQASDLEAGPLSLGLIFAAPAVVCYTFSGRTLRFALGLSALLLAGSWYYGVYGKTLYRLRSFFGVHRVTVDAGGSHHMLVHGNTVHGMQSLNPKERRQPLTYYHHNAPIGELCATLKGDVRLERVGLIGLGAGSLACYARLGERWTYFEIDPAVIAIARDSGYFSFLRDCPARIDITEGDARLTLARCDERFGLLVVDAFSSDSIPLHLLTREALQVYRSHLAPDGILAFHISNRYLDLEPVLGDLAGDAEPPLVCIAKKDEQYSEAEKKQGQYPSHWVLMAAPGALPRRQATSPRWQKIKPRPNVPVWTDDYANLLGAFKWE